MQVLKIRFLFDKEIHATVLRLCSQDILLLELTVGTEVRSGDCQFPPDVKVNFFINSSNWVFGTIGGLFSKKKFTDTVNLLTTLIFQEASQINFVILPTFPQ